MKAKTIFSIIVILLILIAIPVTIFFVGQQQELRKKAAPASTLTLTATNRTPDIDETFTVNVEINTGVNQVTGAELYLAFDATKLEAVDIVAGPFFTSPQTLPKVVDNTNGRLNLALFLTRSGSGVFQPATGTGTVASATFKAKAAGAPVIRLTEATIVGGWGGPNNEDESTDVLTGTTPVTITIANEGGGGDDPDPTPTTAAGTPAPSQTPVPTGTGGAATYTLAVTSPANGATISSTTPTITGTAKPNSTITISITGATTVTGVTSATATGSWSIVPESALAEGAHSVAVTEQAPDGTTRTATSSFTVSTQAPPVSGAVENTLLLVGIGVLFLLAGVSFPYLPIR